MDQGGWMDVALTDQTKVDVTFVYQNNALLAGAVEGITDLSDLSSVGNAERGPGFEPATTYKFRVAAVNGLGVGPWSEVTAYRTLTPGLPGAPNAVKVSKSENGAIVSWDAPPDSVDSISVYAVFLAIKANSGNGAIAKKAQSAFDRVYVGADSSCLVSNVQLQNAIIDTSGGKPAIIFRIAARNDLGFGPATQVRWLQQSS